MPVGVELCMYKSAQTGAAMVACTYTCMCMQEAVGGQHLGM